MFMLKTVEDDDDDNREWTMKTTFNSKKNPIAVGSAEHDTAEDPRPGEVTSKEMDSSPPNGDDDDETRNNENSSPKERNDKDHADDGQGDCGPSRDDKEEEKNEDSIAQVSDLSNVNRRICVVTTAALPWRCAWLKAKRV